MASTIERVAELSAAGSQQVALALSEAPLVGLTNRPSLADFVVDVRSERGERPFERVEVRIVDPKERSWGDGLPVLYWETTSEIPPSHDPDDLAEVSRTLAGRIQEWIVEHVEPAE